MKFQFVLENNHQFGMEKMCRLLEISPSGYYSWKNRPKSERALQNIILENEVKVIFKEGRGSYGSPTIHDVLAKQGKHYGRNRVAAAMKRLQLTAKGKKKYLHTTDSNHDLPIAANHLDRNFTATKANEKWVSDITYVWTQEGWLYLCVVIDLYSRKVVGWCIQERMTTDIITKAFYMAWWRRKPAPGLLFHSDRGSQYASNEFREILKKFKVKQSMSRKGNCWDNACAESFFHTLKVAVVHNTIFKTKANAKSIIFEYIEVFYNQIRKHSFLNYYSPKQFELMKTKKSKVA